MSREAGSLLGLVGNAEVFESKLAPCGCGSPPVLLGSAERNPGGKCVSVSLWRCVVCEDWSWTLSIELPTPFLSGMQAGTHLRRLRHELVSSLYSP